VLSIGEKKVSLLVITVMLKIEGTNIGGLWNDNSCVGY